MLKEREERTAQREDRIVIEIAIRLQDMEDLRDHI